VVEPRVLFLVAGLLVATGCASGRVAEPPPPRPAAPPSTKACGHCGRDVAGRVIEYKHVLYHPECYEKVGPKCGVCAKTLLGPVVRASAGGGPSYHQECWKASPSCDGCGRPARTATQPGKRLTDGRVSCPTCAATAVHDEGEAESILSQARADLIRLLGLERLDDVDVPVRLVARDELLRRAGRELADPDLKAFTQIEERVEGDRLRSRTFEIHVLYGLPRMTLLGVLAHELFHVAQASSGAPRDMDPALREGSSNWAQWRVLVARGEKVRAQQLLEDEDPIYGVGLRRFVRYAERKGTELAVKLGLRGKGFPLGY
jgi:hypothetical protein